jgi:cytochrome b pre-mRNA-processing protein 3
MMPRSEQQAEAAIGVLTRIFGGSRERMVPLYSTVVAEARRPEWYARAQVPDTIDGRFDMVALVLSLVLIRLEALGANAEASLLTEVFIDDMDGTMREIGFGDLVVGKRVGGMMSALGGRLGAYRSGDRRDALTRNLYRSEPPGDAALDAALAMTNALQARIDAAPRDALLEGRFA